MQRTFAPAAPKTSASFRASASSGPKRSSPAPAAAPSTKSTTPAPSTQPAGKSASFQVPAASSTLVASTGRSSGIQCHRCHGLGHVQKDCPSKRSYIATDDGYISTSDVEEDVDVSGDATGDEVFGADDTAGYMNIIVQRVLNTQVHQPE